MCCHPSPSCTPDLICPHRRGVHGHIAGAAAGTLSGPVEPRSRRMHARTFASADSRAALPKFNLHGQDLVSCFAFVNAAASRDGCASACIPCKLIPHEPSACQHVAAPQRAVRAAACRPRRKSCGTFPRTAAPQCDVSAPPIRHRRPGQANKLAGSCPGGCDPDAFASDVLITHSVVLLRACQVDDAELHFLILHFLASGPCRAAASALERDATSHSLLPTRIDFKGEKQALAIGLCMTCAATAHFECSAQKEPACDCDAVG